jgi:hypothetical protein
VGTIVTNATLVTEDTSGSKLYTVTVMSDPETFEQNCAVAQKMADSLEISPLESNIFSYI